MSNRDSTQTKVRYTVRRARCLPGQTLGIYKYGSFTVEGVCEQGISYLLPAPKTLSSGLNTSGSIFPSLRNLSGLKVSGSG